MLGTQQFHNYHMSSIFLSQDWGMRKECEILTVYYS